MSPRDYRGSNEPAELVRVYRNLVEVMDRVESSQNPASKLNETRQQVQNLNPSNSAAIRMLLDELAKQAEEKFDAMRKKRLDQIQQQMAKVQEPAQLREVHALVRMPSRSRDRWPMGNANALNGSLEQITALLSAWNSKT